VLLGVDSSTAEQYASVYAALRRAGRPIPSNDMWIAATALQHGFALFTFDKHFDGVSNLQVGSSLAELTP